VVPATPCSPWTRLSTVVMEVNCKADVTANVDFDISVGSSRSDVLVEENPGKVKEDAVQLSIFDHRFMGIAEQMERTNQRTAISVNIKERLDFSCALFTKDGGLVANAPHIPVHLGAMERAVRFQISTLLSYLRQTETTTPSLLLSCSSCLITHSRPHLGRPLE